MPYTHELIRQVAATLQGARHDQQLSLAEVAARAGMSKTTLRSLEQGATNPTIGTVIAVADVLGLRLDALFAAATATVDATPIVHRHHEPPTASCVARDLRHLATLPSGRTIEIFAVTYRPDVLRRSPGHTAGTIEHLHLAQGHITAGPDDHTVEMTAGDYTRYRADLPHSYLATNGPAHAVLLVERPTHLTP